jgi:hypothetical protein
MGTASRELAGAARVAEAFQTNLWGSVRMHRHHDAPATMPGGDTMGGGGGGGERNGDEIEVEEEAAEGVDARVAAEAVVQAGTAR